MFWQNLIKAKQQAIIKTLDMQTSLHVYSIGFCTNYLCGALCLDLDNIMTLNIDFLQVIIFMCLCFKDHFWSKDSIPRVKIRSISYINFKHQDIQCFYPTFLSSKLKQPRVSAYMMQTREELSFQKYEEKSGSFYQENKQRNISSLNVTEQVLALCSELDYRLQ